MNAKRLFAFGSYSRRVKETQKIIVFTRKEFIIPPLIVSKQTEGYTLDTMLSSAEKKDQNPTNYNRT